MYHLKFNGQHYEIGKKWGESLHKRGISILDNVPFPITDEHISFAEKCEPIYMEFFPEIVEEIKGLAEGNKCDYKKLTALLYGMYCIMPACQCSVFAIKSENHLFLGRNSDFLTAIEKLYMNTIYRFTNKSYDFNANTTAFIQMEDGINEHGFAIGLTSVYPIGIKPGINAGMILRMGLEKCKNVDEFLQMLNRIPISSSQTFIASDSLKNAALIECNAFESEIIKLDDKTLFVCSTNMFNADKMKKYNNLPKDNWGAVERYHTMIEYNKENHPENLLNDLQSLLSGKYGFICQYDRKTGKDTVWSVVYDLIDKKVYRAEGNPARNSFKEDKRFKFKC